MLTECGEGHHGANSDLVQIIDKEDAIQTRIGQVDEIIHVLDPAAQPWDQVGSSGQNLRFLFLKVVEDA